MVVYDFDCTITSIHLYHRLNGGRLEDLKKLDDDELVHIFGGDDRLKRLDLHFDRVKKNNVTLVIISYGYTEVIEKALERVKLNKYWENCKVIGTNSQELKHVQHCKEKVIAKLRDQFSLRKEEVLFVDDDPKNIKAANNSNVCLTIEITPKIGMSDNHMERIETYCEPLQPKTNVNKKKTNNNGHLSKYKPNIPDKYKTLFNQDEENEDQEIVKVVNPPEETNDDEPLSLGDPNFGRSNKKFSDNKD